MFPRGPEEWLGRICLTPLAKERQQVVMWPPSKMKVFSSKLKTGQKKKQCHTLNLDSYGYSHCSLCMQRNENEADRLRVSGPAPAAWGDGVYNVFPNQLLQDLPFSLGSESFHRLHAVTQQGAFSSKRCAGNPLCLRENLAMKCDLRPK